MIETSVELLKNNLKNFLLVSTRGSPSWMNSIRPLEEIQRRLKNQTTHLSQRCSPKPYFSNLQTHKNTFLAPFHRTHLDILSPFFRRSFLRRFFTFGLFVNFVVFFFLSSLHSLLTESSLEEGGGSGSGAARLKVEMELASEKKCLIFLKNFFLFFFSAFPIHVTCLHFE